MNKKHTKQLLNIGKILYSGKEKPITTSLMAFGFECGDGWFYPLRDLSIKLEALNTIYKNYHFHIEAVQVKEKFATLRFYYNMVPHDGITEEDSIILDYVEMLVDEYIAKTEKECEYFCEECGRNFGDWNKNDRVMTRGWMKILCKDCAEKTGRGYDPIKETSDETQCDFRSSL